MTCSLAWSRKDAEGKKFQIEFKLVREDASWQAKRVRFEQREVYVPEPEDWVELLAQMRKNLRRGKLYPTDVRIVERLAEADGVPKTMLAD